MFVRCLSRLLLGICYPYQMLLDAMHKLLQLTTMLFTCCLGLVGRGQSTPASTRLSIEPLEPRLALSAVGLVDEAYVPTGALDGKIVYVHGGHGYTDDGSGWGFQRPLYLEMIEDLGNQDQMTLLADYLFRAGATVVPLRPVGTQTNEFVLDNDDVEVSFTGSWSDSTSSVYFGDAGDVPYRYASTSATETAVARYQPNVTEAGYYPVYAWTSYGSDRAADQLYRVHHAEGTAEMTVNHRQVGNGLIYLGTYYFDEGTNGYVEISNKSSEAGKVVIADMIRFGNGMGDIDRGNGVSGVPREDEAGLYWIEWHVAHSQGIPESEYRASSSDRSATVSLAPRYAEYMNREAAGELADRVFVSYHSNAGSGTSRGVIGLYNGNNDPDTATPNQYELALTLAREVNDDLVALDGSFEYDWHDRGNSLTLDRSDIEFGEINNLRINDEFDATILETGYHDNTEDSRLLRDPKVRDAIARATYQGIVKYFNSMDNRATPLVMAPDLPTGVYAETDAAGSVTVHWSQPAASAVLGDAATGYRVFASTQGYSFDGGTYVAGGSTLSYTFSGLDPKQTYYFQVVAVNQGGSSAGSQVVAAKPLESDFSVLLVNGFDRQARTLNYRQTIAGVGETDRVRPDVSNSGDYLVTVASAIQRNASTVAIASASNESIIAGDVDLSDYDAVIWLLGEESSQDSTFDATEQTLVSQYIARGGNLFVSGSEIGWDLDHLNNGQTFFHDTLGASYVSDDANTYQASGSGLLAGIELDFDDGQMFYDVDYADVLSPVGGTTIATYSTGGGAATYHTGTGRAGDVVVFGFPVESIVSVAARDETITRILGAFGLPTIADAPEETSIDNSAVGDSFSTTGSWNLVRSGTAVGSSYLSATAGAAATATWQFDLASYGQATLYAMLPASTGLASVVYYTVDTGIETLTLQANQAANAGGWISLGTFPVAAGLRSVTLDVASAVGGFVAADSVRLVLADSLPATGDFNGDGTVDLVDYTAWRNTLGKTAVRGDGADANGDMVVDAEDYLWWKQQLGTTASSSTYSSSVATGDVEPAMAAIQQPQTSAKAMPTDSEEASSATASAEKNLAKTALNLLAPPLSGGKRTPSLLRSSASSDHLASDDFSQLKQPWRLTAAGSQMRSNPQLIIQEADDNRTVLDVVFANFVRESPRNSHLLGQSFSSARIG